MTTTNVFQGMDTSANPSSRVLKPPGGGHSDIFGVGPAPTAQAQPVRQNQRNASNIFGADPEPITPNSNRNRPAYHAANSNVFGSDPEPVKPSPKTQSSSNPICASPEETKPAAKPGSDDEDDDDDDIKVTNKRRVETNPITGETRAFTIGGTGESISGRPSTRVKAPPGGASSGIF